MTDHHASQPMPYRTVLSLEEETIRQARAGTDGGTQLPAGDKYPAREAYFGLALSGGGIRSATFNLGILQAMAERRLLSRIDYLSTVSGGGYIGAWLSALINRGAERLWRRIHPEREADWPERVAPEDISAMTAAALRQIECECHDHPTHCPCDGVKHLAMVGEGESQTVSFLRRYSSYLTPRSTFFSLDSLGAVAGLMRNLLLNQAILICLLAAALLVPGNMAFLFERFETDVSFDSFWVLAAVAAGLLLLVRTACTIAWGLRAADCGGKGERAHAGDCGLRQREIVFGLVVPSLLASLVMAFAASALNVGKMSAGAGSLWVSLGATVYTAVWLLGWLVAQHRCAFGRADERNTFQGDLAALPAFVLPALMAGGVAGFMLHGYARVLSEMPADHVAWLSMSFGVVVVWAILCLAVMLHVGLAKRLFTEMAREWLGRSGGLVLSVQLAWMGICVASLYGPAIVTYLGEWATYLGGAWIVHTAAGVWLARGDKTLAGGSDWRETVAQSMPFVFVAGMLILLSAGIHASSWSKGDEPSIKSAQADKPEAPSAGAKAPPASASSPVRATQPSSLERALPGISHFISEVEKTHARSRATPVADTLAALVILAAICALLAWRVDINIFSMHQFYRNRLTRCYLGASNAGRNPERFTDFDPTDDLPLDRLKHQRPVHIINGAMNLTRVRGTQEQAEHGTRATLDWQERMSAPFIFSAHACGFHLPGEPGSFRPTKDYMLHESPLRIQPGGAQLGMAMAVSGAASSPNMGYHTSPALAFVMTFFNVRLGRWCGNPADKEISKPILTRWANPEPRGAWKWSSPWFGLKYLLAELFGAADDRQPFVNISDGGHFENLGIYELVRRRCRLIVACDASRDKDFQFDDLGNAVHKCRVDLGAEIDIDVRALKAPASQRHAVGEIRYADGSTGVLVYIKPVMRGTEPVDVAYYAAAHKDFPHQSTSDQWFDESQFESYRQLGLVTGKEVFSRHQWNTGPESCNQWVQKTAGLLAGALPTKAKGGIA